MFRHHLIFLQQKMNLIRGNSFSGELQNRSQKREQKFILKKQIKSNKTKTFCLMSGLTVLSSGYTDKSKILSTGHSAISESANPHFCVM